MVHLHTKTNVCKILVQELPFGDDAAFVSSTTKGLQRLMDKFNAAWDEFSLDYKHQKTIVMH